MKLWIACLSLYLCTTTAALADAPGGAEKVKGTALPVLFRVKGSVVSEKLGEALKQGKTLAVDKTLRNTKTDDEAVKLEFSDLKTSSGDLIVAGLVRKDGNEIESGDLRVTAVGGLTASAVVSGLAGVDGKHDSAKLSVRIDRADVSLSSKSREGTAKLRLTVACSDYFVPYTRAKHFPNDFGRATIRAFAGAAAFDVTVEVTAKFRLEPEGGKVKVVIDGWRPVDGNQKIAVRGTVRLPAGVQPHTVDFEGVVRPLDCENVTLKVDLPAVAGNSNNDFTMTVPNPLRQVMGQLVGTEVEFETAK